jgi:hypothetical protein
MTWLNNLAAHTFTAGNLNGLIVLVMIGIPALIAAPVRATFPETRVRIGGYIAIALLVIGALLFELQTSAGSDGLGIMLMVTPFLAIPIFAGWSIGCSWGERGREKPPVHEE